MKDTVLVLGADGSLGRELAEVFADDFKVVAFDRPDLDITDREKVVKTITKLKPRYIINSAAYNAVEDAERDMVAYETAKKINAEAVGYLAEAAKIVEAPLVHFSTDYVFSGYTEEGYDENATPDPISKYGETKALGEKFLRENTDQYYLVRLSRLFGSPGNVAGSKQSFVEKIIQLAKQKKEIEFVDEEVSSPTYSKDLAVFVLKLVKEKMPYGIYHGANSGSCTWYGFGKEILSLKKLEVKAIPVSGDKFKRAARRPKNSVLINTKLPPQRSWQSALKEYLK
jgi:dTDP-4-dehydrorhamnose reductase